MIDMHIHAVPPNLPGVGPLDPLLKRPPAQVALELNRQMDASETACALAMGSLSDDPADPLGVDATLGIAGRVQGLYAIGIANPHRTEPAFLAAVDEQIRRCRDRVHALKGYLGYVHVAPTDPRYFPYYELAEKHGLPFIFHTGDTFSPYAKLKYAHPLQVDEVAVDFRGVNFVMAHVGNPWMLDAAEVTYKNMNVWIDLSGLFVGTAEDMADPDGELLRADLKRRLSQAFRYTERPNRFLYGSDWPLAPMADYKRFIEGMIPAEHHEAVFAENACKLFKMEVRAHH